MGVRLLRLLHTFKELQLLIEGLIDSYRVLSWVFLTLLLIVYVCSIFLVNTLGKQCDTDFPDFVECHSFFGSVARCMFTLFQLIPLESWAMAIARPIMEAKAYVHVIFIILYLFVTPFGLMNIVVGVIVD